MLRPKLKETKWKRALVSQAVPFFPFSFERARRAWAQPTSSEQRSSSVLAHRLFFPKKKKSHSPTTATTHQRPRTHPCPSQPIPLYPMPSPARFLLNKCQEKVFSTSFPISRSHTHSTLSSSSLSLNLKRCCSHGGGRVVGGSATGSGSGTGSRGGGGGVTGWVCWKSGVWGGQSTSSTSSRLRFHFRPCGRSRIRKRSRRGSSRRRRRARARSRGSSATWLAEAKEAHLKRVAHIARAWGRGKQRNGKLKWKKSRDRTKLHRGKMLS